LLSISAGFLRGVAAFLLVFSGLRATENQLLAIANRTLLLEAQPSRLQLRFRGSFSVNGLTVQIDPRTAQALLSIVAIEDCSMRFSYKPAVVGRMTQDRISAELGISVGMVKQSASRAPDLEAGACCTRPVGQ
jgi:hypothetical protein